MNFDRAKAIADAVLYEGYILYPYRASAIKNQHRFSFGSLYAKGNDSGEPFMMKAECLVQGKSPSIDLAVRLLHLMNRDVIQFDPPLNTWTEDCDHIGRSVAALDVDGTIHHSWQEAVERQWVRREFSLAKLCSHPLRETFAFDSQSQIEPLIAAGDRCVVGAVRRSQPPLAGQVVIGSQQIAGDLFRLTVEIENQSDQSLKWHGTARQKDDQVFASTHMMMACQSGEFVSLTDPPDELTEAATACHNVGVWPVLAGDVGDRNLLLASPIILPDHPQIAEQSGGDFFDGTEIDEMLTLRVMTMTDAEKAEMQNVDPRARKILERTESISQRQMMKLHGTVRGLHPNQERM